MVSYYCFIPTKGLLSPESKVFKVSVGTSDRELMKLRLMQLYCKDCGFFFRLWSSEVDMILDTMIDPRLYDAFSVRLGYKVVFVSISKLYAAVIDGCVDALDDKPQVAKNFFLLCSKLSPRFYFNNSISSKMKKVPTFPRKNLSDSERNDRLQAIIGFALLFLLYWLGCLVRQWELSTL